jgi:hypothetical protein
MRVDLRHCLRASASLSLALAAASTLSMRTAFGLPRRNRLPKLGIDTSSLAIGRATGPTPSREAAFPSAAFRTDALILYFFENYPYFNGTLITQMVMIKYDFIINAHHLNQRHVRSIIEKLSINIKNKNI